MYQFIQGGNIMTLNFDSILAIINFIMGFFRKLIDSGMIDELA